MAASIRNFVLCVLWTLAAACGGDSSGDSNVVSAKDGGTVTSADGLVTLVFPPGAVDEDTTITIERTDASALPAEIRRLDLLDQIYRLEPDGIAFNVPVEATITLEGVTVPTDESSAIDSVEYFTWDESNGLEPLGDEAITGEVTQAMVMDSDEGTVAVRGTLRHFTTLTGVGSGIRYAFVPPVGSSRPEGGMFEARLFLNNATAPDSGISFLVTSVEPSDTAPVVSLTDPLQPLATLPSGGLMGYISTPVRFRCGPPSGDGSYGLHWEAEVTLPPGAKPVFRDDLVFFSYFEYEGVLLRRYKNTDVFLASGRVWSAVTCGDPDETDSTSTSETSDGGTDTSGPDFPACCIYDACSVMSPDDCEGAGGYSLSSVNSCDDQPCAALEIGACCNPGVCSVATRDSCELGGGGFMGKDSVCDLAPCDFYITELEYSAMREYRPHGTPCAAPPRVFWDGTPSFPVEWRFCLPEGVECTDEFCLTCFDDDNYPRFLGQTESPFLFSSCILDCTYLEGTDPTLLPPITYAATVTLVDSSNRHTQPAPYVLTCLPPT